MHSLLNDCVVLGDILRVEGGLSLTRYARHRANLVVKTGGTHLSIGLRNAADTSAAGAGARGAGTHRTSRQCVARRANAVCFSVVEVALVDSSHD